MSLSYSKLTKRKNLDPSSRREPAKFRSTASSRPRIPIAFGFAARFSPRASFTNQNREFSNSLIQSKKKSSPLCDGGWRMLGGRSLLKRRASIHRAQRHATRHFPTRKTTRIALKTTLSIKRARKIEPHILDLLLNLAPSLPRGAHILDVLCSKEKQKQKRKQKRRTTTRTTSFLLYAVNCIVALCVRVIAEDAAANPEVVSGFCCCCCAFKLRSNACS